MLSENLKSMFIMDEVFNHNDDKSFDEFLNMIDKWKRVDVDFSSLKNKFNQPVLFIPLYPVSSLNDYIKIELNSQISSSLYNLGLRKMGSNYIPICILKFRDNSEGGLFIVGHVYRREGYFLRIKFYAQLFSSPEELEFNDVECKFPGYIEAVNLLKDSTVGIIVEFNDRKNVPQRVRLPLCFLDFTELSPFIRENKDDIIRMTSLSDVKMSFKTTFREEEDYLSILSL